MADPQPQMNYTSPTLLTRRQQNGTFIQQLELPSLPPLSQLLTTEPDRSSKAAAAAAVAAAMTGPSYATQPVYYDYAPTLTSTAGSAEAVAAAAAAAMSTSTSQDVLTMMDQIPLDTVFPTTAAPAQLTTGDPTPHLGYPMDDAHLERRVRHPSESSASSADKIYSFVAIPGTNQRKRPRRRYDEIERLYHCNWPNCTKAYGTLNHLNAHVSMQKHGPKRHPSEFKEMRKEWRRQKKEREAAKKAKDEQMKRQHQEHIYQQQQHQQAAVAAAAAAAVSMPPPPIVPSSSTFQLQQQAYNQLHPSMTLGGFY